ncbi:hypothetical protein GQ53DRAFT_751352 [Thozetella sp. PMI_491]|nr:hypothetical protein GQ53DRAFT_751352 [Thozetella sp. PMI_491]
MLLPVQIETHTRGRSPQLNEDNMSSVQTTDATATGELPTLVGGGVEVVSAADCLSDRGGGPSFPDDAGSSRSQGTATTESSTVHVDNENKAAPMHEVHEPTSTICGPGDDNRHSSSMGLTEERLREYLQLDRSPPVGVDEWVKKGIHLSIAGQPDYPAPSESLRPKKSSKPSVASSGYHDFHVVIVDDFAESIVAVGSQYDNCVMDPNILDQWTLSFP